MEYIQHSRFSRSFHQLHRRKPAKCKFFSFHIDGFADAGNLEDELIVVQYSMKDSNLEKVKSITRYLTVCNPVKCDADGLLNCLSSALNQIGIEDNLDKESVLGIQQIPALVGGATDGDFVNIGQHSDLRGKLVTALPWLFWSWCYFHRLEVACKNSFVSPLCNAVSEMLL